MSGKRNRCEGLAERIGKDARDMGSHAGDLGSYQRAI